MRPLVLALDAAFLAAAFGLRTLAHWRRTGDTGWRLGRPASRAEGAARALMLASAPLLLAGLVQPDGASHFALAGLALMLAGLALTLSAQWNMGAAWRIGVDPSERTELVRDGLYRWVRNPIYTGMVLFALGQAAMTPNAWACAAVAALALGVEIQVRAVEEPHLAARHGERFAEWAARAGRFAPFVGRNIVRPGCPR
jgi:protein-S-isoprenylcysteine O-methyltransferase Ste14